MRVIGYIRVSTDGQVGEDKFGLKAQMEAIEAYCAKEGHIIDRWVSDEGESGAKERPGFDGIIYGEVQNPPIEAVIVARSDRVARDINVYYYYKMMLRKKDIELVSVSEDFGQMGVFASMLEAFTLCAAQMERENITKRTSAGRNLKAQSGGHAGGRTPLGYKSVDKQYVIDEEYAPVVKKIFQMHDDGATLREIADTLNAEGIRTRKGKEFNFGSIKHIVWNRKLYEGWYKYGDGPWVKGKHEAILEPESHHE